jgi:phytoene dehydrogenase-like protein
MSSQCDVAIVGAGHNGLVAAGLLARQGLSVQVFETRDIVGGAAVSEHPFGLDYTVTSLSYVVSLLPPSIVNALNLTAHGYHVYPQGPYFAPRREGRALSLPTDPAARHAQIAAFSPEDADSYQRWEADLDRLGAILGPLLGDIPPALGSRRPAELARQALLLRRLKDVDTRAAVDLTRLLSSSIADLVEDRFTSEAMRGVLSVSGIIGTWAGPRSAGTAYVMLHHHVGDLGEAGDGSTGAWGFPRGGMGGVTRALASAARSFGATIRTGAPVARIDVRDGTATGLTLVDGTEITASTVITTAHPTISFLRLLDPRQLPADFVADIESWKSRSGTVKVNLAVDRRPRFTARPEFDPQVYGGTIVLAESLDDLEGAYQDAVAGRPASLPFADVCIPSVVDPTLAPEGHHIVSMFTQWVPHTWNAEPHRDELETYADRLVARMDAVAPGFADSVLHRQVIGPYEMEHTYGLIGGNIFHGELTLGQMFHARPAAGYADLRTPVRGLYQAGSATHGGGGVTGIPGRNVVHQILADRRRARLTRRVPGLGNLRTRTLRGR